VAKTMTAGFKAADESILLLGETSGHLGQTLYLRELAGIEAGPPPPVNLAAERRTGDLVRDLIKRGLVTAVHDISDGGLLVAVAEMALAGNIGATIEGPESPGWLFGEDQGRYVVVARDPQPILAAAKAAGVPCTAIGRTGGAALKVAAGVPISMAELRAAHEGWLPAYMAAP
jgi:phosphoribosylformylglycinamidine synthase